jgi:hypothetical protein
LRFGTGGEKDHIALLATGLEDADLAGEIQRHAGPEVTLLLTVQAEQSKGQVAAIIQEQIHHSGCDQIFAGEHRLADRARVDICNHHQIVEEIVKV